MNFLLPLFVCLISSGFSETNIENLEANKSTLTLNKDINLFINSTAIEIPSPHFDPKLKEVIYLKKENCKMIGVMRANLKPENIKSGTSYKFFQNKSLPDGSTVIAFRRLDTKNLLLIECRSGFMTAKSITKILHKEFDETFTISP